MVIPIWLVCEGGRLNPFALPIMLFASHERDEAEEWRRCQADVNRTHLEVVESVYEVGVRLSSRREVIRE